ncbi:MAG TPA: sigma-54 dependent transcriptional regulator [Pirellulales bacterium]|nr:sigma-54 dependent transcriptional regulator [Pirellulales bacterium]
MATVLVIDDDRTVLHVIERIFANSDTRVVTARNAQEGVSLLPEAKPDVVILDIMLPDQSGLDTFQQVHAFDSRLPVIFITAGGTSETAIEAMKLGAYDYLVKPLDVVQVKDLVNRALEIRRAMHVPVQLSETEPPADGSDQFIGRCAAMQDVFKKIGRVAPHNVTVLIRGETGTGQELVARAIYQHSPRSNGRFLAVNMSAIPDTLLESELFGHEKGSFTGAENRRIGRFEQCSGGTLFLDEIGDLSPMVQSKLLRLLQEQRFERVGGNETIRTDVRVIAATNRDLEKRVEDGDFRADLYYRLNGFTIQLPPLRERGDDLIFLIGRFIRVFAQDLGKDVVGVSPEAMQIMIHYSWPGNIRELQSVVRQALLQANGQVLLPEFLPDEVREGRRPLSPGQPASNSGLKLESFIDEQLSKGTEGLHAASIAVMERYLLARVLERTSGNQSQAAKILGITRGSLRNKIRQYHIAVGAVVSTGNGDGLESDDGEDEE